MKWPIFALLIPFIGLVEAQEMKPLSEQELKKKFVSLVKDYEVGNALEKSDGFAECRKKNEFKQPDVAAAVKCFKEKLPKDKAELEKLSQKLGLHNYGLIQSKNVKDISDYLGDKMYESLTGIKPQDEKDNKLIKISARKIVDQKVFIRLYTTQLGKNALFEISRFCFENLRLTAAPKPGADADFSSYWERAFQKPVTVSLNEITDIGSNNDEGGFGNFSNVSSKEEAYKSLFKGVGKDGNINAEQLGGFFNFCSQYIVPLCDSYKGKIKTDPTEKRGANACLTQDKLQQARKAIINSQLIEEEFKKMEGGTAVSLDKTAVPLKFYTNGNAANEKSIDELTNISSFDVLEGGNKKNGAKDSSQDCAEKPEDPKCSGFIEVDDSRLKVEHNIDMEMRLKKEVEVARVRQLKKENDKDLKKYLEDNGYFDLLSDVENLTEDQLAEAIESNFDAKRLATVNAIKEKLGKRQISEDEIKALGTNKDDLIKDQVKSSEQERARLAQVVLFNNIITSHLDLKKKNSNNELEDMGRNVNAWKAEEQGLVDSKIDTKLFENLKNSIKPGKEVNTKDASVVGISALDSILGKPEEETKKH